MFVLLLLYAIATVFQLYPGHDMLHEMWRRKPELSVLPTQEIFNLPHHKHDPTLLLSQWIFNLPHHIGMVQEELAFHDAVSYAQQGEKLQKN